MESENNTIDTSTMKMPGGKVSHSNLGPILGVLLILLVIVAAGLYLWGAELIKNKETPIETERVILNNEPETARAEVDMQILGTLSSSNELETIEADVTSTDLDSIDTDIAAVEREFDSVAGPQ